jgi:hypothetical protein
MEKVYKSDSEFKKYFSPNAPIGEALSLAIEYLKADGTIMPEDFLRKHAQGKPVIIPIRWKEEGENDGHAIALIIWNDILVVCNRGDKKFEEGISVFQIAPGKMTVEFLQNVLPQTEIASPETILIAIQTLSGHAEPILTFPTQDQKHGTCGFVNVKSSFQPLLCFIELWESRAQLSPFKILDSEFLKSYIQDGKPLLLLQDTMKHVRIQYKTVTDAMRNQKVRDLCEDFKKLALGSEERKIYFQLFKEILEQHPGEHKTFEFYLTSYDDNEYGALSDTGKKIGIRQNNENQLEIFCKDHKEKEDIHFICGENLQTKLMPYFDSFRQYLPQIVTKDQIGEDIYMMIEEEIKSNGGYVYNKNPKKRLAEIERARMILAILEEETNEEGQKLIDILKVSYYGLPYKLWLPLKSSSDAQNQKSVSIHLPSKGASKP